MDGAALSLASIALCIEGQERAEGMVPGWWPAVPIPGRRRVRRPSRCSRLRLWFGSCGEAAPPFAIPYFAVCARARRRLPAALAATGSMYAGARSSGDAGNSDPVAAKAAAIAAEPAHTPHK